MLQNTRVTTFTVAELLRENQQEGEGGGVVKLLLPRLGLNCVSYSDFGAYKILY